MAKTIKLADVRKLPRGRKSNIDPKLVATLRKLTNPTSALDLSDEFKTVPADKRQKVSQTIRQAWQAAHGDDVKVSINYSPEGTPQVNIKTA